MNRALVCARCSSGALAFLLVLVSGVSTVEAGTLACTPSAGYIACTRITASGGDQTFTVPPGVTSIEVKLWGAAGGGANSTWYSGQGGGAAGGFATATVAVTPGQTLTLVVGSGGAPTSSATTYGGGGAGGTANNANTWGGSGGGMSAIFSSSSKTAATVLVVAGGGGGASPGADSGVAGAGGGGGTTGGQDALPARSGRGGTQAAGGAAGTANSNCSVLPTNGAQFQGGNGGNSSTGTNSWEGGGGGGGGYFGGGGGMCQSSDSGQNGGGGGGSSFTGGTGVTSGTTAAGANFLYNNSSCTTGTSTPGGSGDTHYTAGIGVGSCFGTGGSGEIVIQIRRPVVRFQKISLGGTGTFSFNSPVNIASAPGNITTATAGTAAPAFPAAINVSALNTDVSITETPAAGYAVTAVSCTDANSSLTGNPGTFSGTFSGNVITIDRAFIKSSADITCTITNTRPRIAFQKASFGGTGTFSFTASSNLASTPGAITTSTAGTPAPVSPTFINVTNVGQAVTLTEGLVSGYNMSGFTCTDSNAAFTGNPSSFGTFVQSTRVATISASNIRAGANITCVVSNATAPTLQLRKAWGANSVAADSITIGATTGGSSNTAPFSASGGTAASSGAAVNVTVGNTITLPAETFAPAARAANYSTVLSCLANGGPTANALSGTDGQQSNTLLIGNADAGKAIVCTYTNTRRSTTFRLSKAWGANSISGNVANLAATTGLINNTAAFAANAGTAVNGATVTVFAGEIATLPAETLSVGTLANYTTTISCNAGTLTGTNGQAAGNTLAITAAAISTSPIDCTYTNTRRSASLTLRKTWVSGTSGDTATVVSSGFINTATSGLSTSSGNNTTAGTAVTVFAGESGTISETMSNAAAYSAALACTGTSGLSGTTLTVGSSDTNIVCTYTNSRRPRVAVHKATTASFGGPFAFATTNLSGSIANISTSVAGTPTPASPLPLVVTITGSQVQITESFGLSFVSSGVSCTDLNSAFTGNSNPVATSTTAAVVIPGAALVTGADVRCLFTNAAAAPQLTVNKSANVTTVDEVGDPIVYSITVSNTGNVVLTGITVADALGTVVCPTSGNNTIATLALGANETCSLTYSATQANFDTNGGGDGDIDNTASAATTYNGTPISGSGAATVGLTIINSIEVTKRATTPGPFNVGDTITYKYRVENKGNQTLTGVVVTDTHNAWDPAPTPGSEVMFTDVAPFLDSSDSSADGVWDTLRSKDVVEFTGTYVVHQFDHDLLQ